MNDKLHQQAQEFEKSLRELRDKILSFEDEASELSEEDLELLEELFSHHNFRLQIFSVLLHHAPSRAYNLLEVYYFNKSSLSLLWEEENLGIMLDDIREHSGDAELLRVMEHYNAFRPSNTKREMIVKALRFVFDVSGISELSPDWQKRIQSMGW